jgi:uncharacterized membrane protein YhaH (DUF805 family)
MTFWDAVRVCFLKYADFTGRATRPEYWWFVLFIIIVSFVVSMGGNVASSVFMLATLVPCIAVATRRLHDTNRSGWWQLICLVPVVGLIVLIVFLAQKSVAAPALAPPEVSVA